MQETDRNFEKRKKVIYQFMQDELYVPMKLKEIMLFFGFQGRKRGIKGSPE